MQPQTEYWPRPGHPDENCLALPLSVCRKVLGAVSSQCHKALEWKQYSCKLYAFYVVSQKHIGSDCFVCSVCFHMLVSVSVLWIWVQFWLCLAFCNAPCCSVYRFALSDKYFIFFAKDNEPFCFLNNIVYKPVGWKLSLGLLSWKRMKDPKRSKPQKCFCFFFLYFFFLGGRRAKAHICMQ